MLFRLKNTHGTYKCAMSKIFDEQPCKIVEYYQDKLEIKSCNKGDHLQDLKMVFDIMRKHQLKINPTKIFLDVSSGKFLRFVVTSRRICHDPDKI